jgi:hypothetical protein
MLAEMSTFFIVAQHEQTIYLYMHSTASALLETVNEYLPKLNSLTEEKSSIKPLPNKWSKKELIGHLIDSAQNNIRRFIVAQYEDNPVITYKQDNWVSINNYQSYSLNDLIQLWYLLNKQICSILNNSSNEMLQRTCQTESLHSIEWLAKDYIRHMKHHLHQVLDLTPIVYP